MKISCKHCGFVDSYRKWKPTSWSYICPNCNYHRECTSVACGNCCTKQTLENIRNNQGLVKMSLGHIFGQDVQKLLVFLNGRILSKYLIAEILTHLPWAKEFSFKNLFNMIKN